MSKTKRFLSWFQISIKEFVATLCLTRLFHDKESCKTLVRMVYSFQILEVDCHMQHFWPSHVVPKNGWGYGRCEQDATRLDTKTAKLHVAAGQQNCKFQFSSFFCIEWLLYESKILIFGACVCRSTVSVSIEDGFLHLISNVKKYFNYFPHEWKLMVVPNTTPDPAAYEYMAGVHGSLSRSCLMDHFFPLNLGGMFDLGVSKEDCPQYQLISCGK